MIKTHSGKLRAIGYDASTRTLRVELENGSALEYTSVGESIWRQLKHSGTQWSFYRDNIEEVFTSRTASKNATPAGKNPLDDLFSK